MSGGLYADQGGGTSWPPIFFSPKVWESELQKPPRGWKSDPKRNLLKKNGSSDCLGVVPPKTIGGNGSRQSKKKKTFRTHRGSRYCPPTDSPKQATQHTSPTSRPIKTQQNHQTPLKDVYQPLKFKPWATQSPAKPLKITTQPIKRDL
jgi:hypothetical protein